MKSLIVSMLWQEPLKIESWSQPNVRGCNFSMLEPNCSLSTSPLFTPTFNPSLVSNSCTCWQPLPTTLDVVVLLEDNGKFAPKPFWWHSRLSPQNSNWIVKKNPVVDLEGKYPTAISPILEGFRRDNPHTHTKPKLVVSLAVSTYLLGAAAN